MITSRNKSLKSQPKPNKEHVLKGGVHPLLLTGFGSAGCNRATLGELLCPHMTNERILQLRDQRNRARFVQTHDDVFQGPVSSSARSAP